jgi:threonine dehydrogenase-like Zn-dependent dehydrogenase
MQALVFRKHLPRIAATRFLGTFSPRAYVGRASPLQLCDVPEPELPGDDWVLLATRLCGVCGSDSKQVFLEGSWDNPMTALISFPQILGHEVVADVLETGPAVRRLTRGDRVVLNPWLSCAPRGLPACEWCERGELAQCRNFTRGRIGPGIHTGNSRDAGGGFAPRLPAHESQCIPVPDAVSDEAAVLADPFSVSLHAVLHEPPPEGGAVLVYGCGTLGLLSIAILRRLHPSVRVLAVARFAHQARLAEALGAERALPHRPTGSLVEQVAGALGVDLQRPERGLPMLNGGVDVVYDSVASAETLEVGVRVVRPRGRIVATGVSTPRRFEWTPLYFKEIKLIGSNAFAIEEYEGRRQHAMAWYLEWAQADGLDVTSIVTHRYALSDYPEAFLACHDQGRSGAVKVLFDYGGV